MIKNFKDYRDYLTADKTVYNIKGFWKSIPIFQPVTYRYVRQMRRLEWLYNYKNNHLIKLLCFLFAHRFNKLSVMTGISIPPYTFGKGLHIAHYGSIVVNSSARFGDFCVIQNGVNISHRGGGNFIYFAAGSKVIVGVQIADYVIIGANAVVTKSVNEANVVVAGVPAKIISHNGHRNRVDF